MFNETMSELADLCIARVNANFKDPMYVRECKHRGIDTDNRVVGFSWQVKYSKCVSNTHDAPKGKKTNWGYRDKDYPNGFPGFEGRVWIRYENSPVSFYSSDVFNKTCFHTGTGGFGCYNHPVWEKLTNKLLNKGKNRKRFDSIWHSYSWDFRFFTEDFPQVEEMLMWEKLRGTDYASLIHHCEWEDRVQLKWLKDQFNDSILV
jgi:hypothetical protein